MLGRLLFPIKPPGITLEGKFMECWDEAVEERNQEAPGI